jgi:hypothetical protein
MQAASICRHNIEPAAFLLDVGRYFVVADGTDAVVARKTLWLGSMYCLDRVPDGIVAGFRKR